MKIFLSLFNKSSINLSLILLVFNSEKGLHNIHIWQKLFVNKFKISPSILLKNFK